MDKNKSIRSAQGLTQGLRVFLLPTITSAVNWIGEVQVINLSRG